MLPWPERQREFAAALLDARLPAPAGLIDPQGRECPRRFGVYRNNVAVALIEALEISFPAVRRLVGAEFFREAARRYATSDLPISPVLLEYGAGFPAFLARFEPAATLPYLPDVARIERAWIEAHHAADASPLDPAEIARVPAARTAELRFVAHPSVRVVRSRYPSLTIWQMNAEDGVPAPVDLDSGGEDVLVVRPAAQVVVRRMPPGGADLLEALARGEPLGRAAEGIVRRAAQAIAHGSADRDPAELVAELANHLRGLLESGAFAGFTC